MTYFTLRTFALENAFNPFAIHRISQSNFENKSSLFDQMKGELRFFVYKYSPFISTLTEIPKNDLVDYLACIKHSGIPISEEIPSDRFDLLAYASIIHTQCLGGNVPLSRFLKLIPSLKLFLNANNEELCFIVIDLIEEYESDWKAFALRESDSENLQCRKLELILKKTNSDNCEEVIKHLFLFKKTLELYRVCVKYNFEHIFKAFSTVNRVIHIVPNTTKEILEKQIEEYEFSFDELQNVVSLNAEIKSEFVSEKLSEIFFHERFLNGRAKTLFLKQDSTEYRIPILRSEMHQGRKFRI